MENCEELEKISAVSQKAWKARVMKENTLLWNWPLFPEIIT